MSEIDDIINKAMSEISADGRTVAAFARRDKLPEKTAQRWAVKLGVGIWDKGTRTLSEKDWILIKSRMTGQRGRPKGIK